MPSVAYDGFNYCVPSATVTIGTTTFDVTKAPQVKDCMGIITKESELARLYLNALPRPVFCVSDGVETFTRPAKTGVNLETATFTEINDFIPNFKSESMKELCRRVLDIRFPTEFNSEVDKVDPSLKEEYELIRDSSRTKDVTWLGEVGFQNKVRLDGSLDRKVKLKL